MNNTYKIKIKLKLQYWYPNRNWVMLSVVYSSLGPKREQICFRLWFLACFQKLYNCDILMPIMSPLMYIYKTLWTALLTESRGPAVDLSFICFQKQMKTDRHPSRCVIYICICNQRKLCLRLIKTQLNPTHQYESSV